MTPWPDRAVIVGMLITMGSCFALIFWFVRLQPAAAPPLEWRQRVSAPPLR